MADVMKKSLQDLLADIDDPRRDVLLQIYHDHYDLFHTAKGSTIKHQAWKGGYADHVAECLRINEVTYDALKTQMRDPGFSKASAAIALFFHDIEKPFRYGDAADARVKKWHDIFNQASGSWEQAKWDIIRDLQEKYVFDLTDEEINALKYTHGEGKAYRPDKRIALPLASHIHVCDTISARIWHDEGRGMAAPDLKI
ncbi:MAG: hypothetical protein H6867_04015 [Rhodospirillales bacterium]|nr:hypothetical protein [Rhodospirillales bacterium]MCB9996316.1 hypothetical protein [Rhodospirillales bacterium]